MHGFSIVFGMTEMLGLHDVYEFILQAEISGKQTECWRYIFRGFSLHYTPK